MIKKSPILNKGKKKKTDYYVSHPQFFFCEKNKTWKKIAKHWNSHFSLENHIGSPVISCSQETLYVLAPILDFFQLHVI